MNATQFAANVLHAECVPAQQVGPYSIVPGIHTPECLYRAWGLNERKPSW